MPSALAFRYARALADLGADAESVLPQMQAFESALNESSDLRIVLESPAVPPPRKRAVISRMAELLGLSDVVRRLLLVVVDHRRVPLLADIREAFEAVMDERHGVVRVDVISARELAPAQRQYVLEGLNRLTGKGTRPRFSTSGDLIGGVVARIGSTVYDGSVRGQLQTLKHKLAGAEG